MRRALIATMLLGAAVSPAWALQAPQAGRADERIRTITYNASQVINLSAATGQTLTVQFGDGETIQQVALSDTVDIKRAMSGNVLWLKPTGSMASQPISVLTTMRDGHTRLYLFQWQADPTTEPYYLVRFAYPSDEYAARVAAWRARQAERDQQAAVAALKAPPPPVAVNTNYIAQGDKTILPPDCTNPGGATCVWDDGNSTFIRFPGNMRIPSLYVIDPDGKEATAPYSIDGSLVTIHQTARGFRLRDGATVVLCIWNQSFSAIGNNPGTGTISPNVQRVLKGGE